MRCRRAGSRPSSPLKTGLCRAFAATGEAFCWAGRLVWSQVRRTPHYLGATAGVLTHLGVILFSLAFIVFFCAAAAEVLWHLSKKPIVVQHFSVPDRLRDQGYQGDVLSRALHEELVALRDCVNSSNHWSTLALPSRGAELLPTYSVAVNDRDDESPFPQPSLFARWIIAYWSSRSVSGDVVELADGTVTMALRFSDGGTGAIATRPDSDMRRVLRDAAGLILRRFQPYPFALCAYSRREEETAIETLVSCSQSPSASDALDCRTALLFIRGRCDEIDKLAVPDEGPPSKATLTAVAAACHNKGGRNQAAAAIKALAAIAMDRDLVVALNELGFAQMTNKQFDAAIATFDAAIAINPTYAEAHLNRGSALRLKTPPDLDGAIDAFRTAQRLSIAQQRRSLEALVLNEWGWALHETRDLKAPTHNLQDAADKFNQATNVDPTASYAWASWATALNDLGELDNAIEKATRATELNRQQWQAYNEWGWALNQQGNHAAAIPKLEAAIDLAPGSPEPHKNLGDALRASGDSGTAIDAYQRAVDRGHKDSAVLQKVIDEIRTGSSRTPP